MSQQPRRQKRAASSEPVSGVSAHVGMRMRVRRRMLSVDLDKLAKMVQVPEVTLATIEDGTSIVDVSVLFRIAAALEVPMHWFYDGIDPALYAPLEQSDRTRESAAQEINATLTERADRDLLTTYFDTLDQPSRSALVQLARLLAEKGNPS
jgi:transcriptional regulator with XRE-family HTH domain